MRIFITIMGLAACSSGAGKTDARADGPSSIPAPLSAVSLASEDIEHGKALFLSQNCIICHNTTGAKKIGPGLKGVTQRRSLKWIQRILIDPETMERDDAIAKELALAHPERRPEHGVEQTWMLPALLAYLKSID